ncbi:MAG TPA: class IV adenylate cyclase [Patescibacteria group bacterium]|nr:class IV adenylate cyclase [Patescibacteria group bacterium]
MREIEVKAQLKDKDGFLKAAKQLGIQFNDIVIQEDKTYETKAPYDDPNWNIFRLRKQGNKIILTMKHKASTRSRDNYEYETVIENEDETVKMLERLGYGFGIGVNKKRRKAKYNDLELCLDEIDQLGSFVEVEKLAEDEADVDAIQSELWSLLESLGVDIKDRVHKGYDTLMHEFKRSGL